MGGVRAVDFTMHGVKTWGVCISALEAKLVTQQSELVSIGAAFQPSSAISDQEDPAWAYLQLRCMFETSAMP